MNLSSQKLSRSTIFTEILSAGRGGVFFAGDEGIPYPNALSPLPLSQLLAVQAPTSNDVWNVGLEAVRTGLFEWVLLKPSRTCSVAHLRRLQIQSEQTKTHVFLLSKLDLPHWCLRKNLRVLP